MEPPTPAGRLVFVVGSRRSGTNYVQRVLGSHPTVAVVQNESYLFSHALAPLAEQVQHGSAGAWRVGGVYLDRDEYLRAVRMFADLVFETALRTSGKPHDSLLVERTPEHAHHLDLIGAAYPDAAVIHVIRDGRDVARSLLSVDFGPETFEAAVEEWRSTVEAARASADSLHRYVEVRYEALLTDPVSGFCDLFTQLGVPIDDDVRAGIVAEAGVSRYADASAPELVEAKWRKHLTSEQLEKFDELAGRLSVDLGYAESTTGATPGATSPAPVTARPSRLRRWRTTRRGRTQRADDRPAVRAGQEDVERLLEGVILGRTDDVVDSFTETAKVSIITGGRLREWRGHAGVRTWMDHLSADPTLRARQLHSTVHPAVPTTTVVTTHAGANGPELRVVALTMQDSKCTDAVVYGASTTEH